MSKRSNSKSSILKYSLLLATALSSPLTYATTSVIKFDASTGRSIEVDRSIVNGSRVDNTNTSFQDQDDLQLNFDLGNSEISFKASDAIIGNIIGSGDNAGNFAIAGELPFDSSKFGKFKIEGYNVSVVGKIGRIDILQLATTMKDSTNPLDADNQALTIIKPNNVKGLVMNANAIQLDKFNKIEFDASDIAIPGRMIISLSDGVYSSDDANRGAIIFNTVQNKNIIFNGAIGPVDAGQYALALLETKGAGDVKLNNGLRKDSADNATATAITVAKANFGATNTHISHHKFDVTGDMTIRDKTAVNLRSTEATINNLTIEGAGKLDLQPNAISSANKTTVQALTMNTASTITVGKDITLDLQAENPALGKLDIANGATVNLRDGTSLNIDELTLRGVNLKLPSANNPAITTLNILTDTASNVSTITDAKSIGDLNITNATLDIAGAAAPELTGTIKVNGASNLTGKALDRIPILILSDASTFVLPAKSDGTFIPVGDLRVNPGAATLTKSGNIDKLTINGSKLMLDSASGGRPVITNLIASGDSSIEGAQEIGDITLNGAKLELQGATTVKNLLVTANSSLEGDYGITNPAPTNPRPIWKISRNASLQLDSIADLSNIDFDCEAGALLHLNTDATFTTTPLFAGPAAPSVIVMIGDRTFIIEDNVEVNVPLILPEQNNQGTIEVGATNTPLPQLGGISGSNNFYFKNVVFNKDIELDASSKIYTDQITANGELDINGISNDTIQTKKVVIGDAGKVIISADDIIKLDATRIGIYPENSGNGVIKISGSDRDMARFKMPIIGDTTHVLGELELNNLRADLDGAHFHVNDLKVNNSNIELSGEVNLHNAEFNDIDLNLARHNINAGTIRFSGTNTIKTFINVDGHGNVVDNGKIIATGSIDKDPSGIINVVITSNDIAHIPAGTTIDIFQGAVGGGSIAPGAINAPIDSVTAATRTPVVSATAGKVEFNDPAAPVVPPLVVHPVIHPAVPPVLPPQDPTILPISGNTPFSIPVVVDNDGNITIKFNTDFAKVDEAVQAFTSAISDSHTKEIFEFIGRNIDTNPRGGNILSAAYNAKNDAAALKVIVSSLDDIKQDKKSVDDLGRFVLEELPDTLPLFTPQQQQPVASGDSDDARVWTKFVGRKADQGETSDLAGYEGKFYGVMLGISKNVSNNLSLGAAVGSVSADFAYKRDNAANKLNTGSKVAYLYGDYRLCKQKMFLQTLLSYSSTNIDSSHARGKDGIATGQHSADTFGGLARLGYVFDVAHSLNFTPTIGVIKHYTKEQGYTETGAANWNFMVDADAARNSAVLTLGASLAAKTADRSILPEVHFNMYKPLQHSTDEAKFGFDWLKEKRFAAGRIAPNTSFNVGGKVKTHVRGLDVEAGVDLYFSGNSYSSQQGYLGVKIDF